MSFFENTRKPVGFGGKLMVAMMNPGHSPVAQWGLQFLELAPDDKVLDCGCGGGANMTRLLKKCPQGVVKGIDYSPVSVEKAQEGSTRAAISGGALRGVAGQRGEYDLCEATGSMRSLPLKPSISGLICRSASARFTGC